MLGGWEAGEAGGKRYLVSVLPGEIYHLPSRYGDEYRMHGVSDHGGHMVSHGRGFHYVVAMITVLERMRYHSTAESYIHRKKLTAVFEDVLPNVDPFVTFVLFSSYLSILDVNDSGHCM